MLSDVESEGIGVDVDSLHREPTIPMAQQIAGGEDEGIGDGAMDTVEEAGDKRGCLLHICLVAPIRD